MADHEQAVDEDADHDRRDAVEDVEGEADAVPDGTRSELVDVDRDEDANRQGHQRGEPDDHEAAGERIGEAFGGGMECIWILSLALRQQVEIELTRPAFRYRPDDDAEDRDGDRGGQQRERLHASVDDPASPQPVVGALQRAEIDGAHRAASP